MVAGDPIHTGRAQRRAAEQVATANDQANLNADTDQLADFQRHAVQHLGINPELFGAHQGLAAKLE
ncbi:hypothetical protein D3C71_2238070 [compost metagenome]